MKMTRENPTQEEIYGTVSSVEPDPYPLHYKLRLLRALIGIFIFCSITVSSLFFDFSVWMNGLHVTSFVYMAYFMKNTDRV